MIQSNLTITIQTYKGDIKLRLFDEHTPVTVVNFVNLINRGYFDKLNFHRVIPNFMVQSGCPFGTGTGDPGYRFEDEFHKDLMHDKAGILSMANAGPGTNGSQFFITHGPTPHLDDRHTVFGEVVGSEDQAVVDSIEQEDKIKTMTLEGDASALLGKHQSRVDEWNRILTSTYKHLKEV